MYGAATVIYNTILLPTLSLALRVGALFSPKIRRGFQGRKFLFNQLDGHIPKFSDTTLRFWIHSSSMGEFEQARPVVSALRKQYSGSVIIMSVFSPLFMITFSSMMRQIISVTFPSIRLPTPGGLSTVSNPMSLCSSGTIYGQTICAY